MFVVTVDEKNRSLFEHMVAEEFFDPLDREGHYVLGAIGEDEYGMYAAGVLSFDVIDDYDGESRILIGMLRWLYVAEEFRNRGAADALMEEFFRLLAHAGIEVAIMDMPFNTQYDELCMYLEGWGFSFFLTERFELRVSMQEVMEVPELWGKASQNVVPISKLEREEIKNIIRKAEELENIDPDFRDKIKGCDKNCSAAVYQDGELKGLAVIYPVTSNIVEISFFRMFEKNAAGIKDLFYHMSKQILETYGEEVQIRGICRDEVNGNMIGKLFPHIEPLLVHRGVCLTLDEEE